MKKKTKNTEAPNPNKTSAPRGGMRLNKYVAHSGICSRRQAAELVKKGQIKVNGKVEINPGYLVLEKDKVEYKGRRIEPEKRKVYILLNKPKNVITTTRDEQGRSTVMDIIQKKVKERVYPVGRLDRGTTGLILITNDGDLAKKLSHPSHEVKKFYHVVLDKPLEKSDLEKIRKGVELEEGVAIVDAIDYVGHADKNEVGIELHLGWNRVIRRIFEKLGYEVVRLDRTWFAGLTKKGLPRGRFRHLTQQEIIMLKHFV